MIGKKLILIDALLFLGANFSTIEKWAIKSVKSRGSRVCRYKSFQTLVLTLMLDWHSRILSANIRP
jgi:hypothetical protein